MNPPLGDGSPRIVRGAIVATLAIAVSVTSHSFGGGKVSVGTTLTLTLLAGAVGIATSGRQFTFSRALVVIAALQPLLHVTLVGTAHHAETTEAGSSHGDAEMVLSHIAATVVAAAALAAMDRVIWRWVCDSFSLPAIASTRTTQTFVRAREFAQQFVATTQWIVWLTPWRGPPKLVKPHPS